MIKQTRKYLKALEVSDDFFHHTSDELYQYLTVQGYYWDANCGLWIKAADQSNDPPSTQVKIRIWADKNQVIEIAEKAIEALTDQEFRFIEKSIPYPCRPPKANDARVYLTFEKI
jgi:hypothetical protein